MERQGALADAPFARADRHEMTHAGEPIGDSNALLGDLLEDSRPTVPDDVVVRFHVECLAYTANAQPAFAAGVFGGMMSWRFA
jgi:hypothetical protein